MEKITNITRAFFRMCAAISFSGFTEMAPTLTPLAPAAFFALAIATAFYDRLPESLHPTAAIGLAIVVGLVAAGGLEAAGFMAFHSAIEAYRHGAGWRAGILPGLYLVIGITALWVVEEETTATIGTALFLLAATVYAARMVMHDAKQKVRAAADAEQRQAEEEARAKEHEEKETAEERAYQRQQQQLAEQREHELKMAQLQADKEVKIKQAERPQVVASRSESNRQLTELPSDFRLLNDRQKAIVADLTSGELQELADISASTARRWKRNVTANGHLNGVSK